MSVSDLRQDYDKFNLQESDLAATPFDQFDLWFSQALQGDVPEPNAMTLATVDERGQPSARIVLIKDYDARGFVFYTNYQSRKGHELAHNTRASLSFFWQPLQRQVLIEGTTEQVSREESQTYFHSRPLGSRIGAWASQQSHPIGDRSELERRVQQFEAQYGDHPPCPDHWGGYRLLPERVEFWQGRPSRLHDRIVYHTNGQGGWTTQRLAP
ncbi:MAG: pyridoxamine 5'-phosphate oxidase [Corticimicrobacter sp.]|uniref:pyridoxamine 5'-phosphate oxidase n=1 Tax=Corticimicrobacter sp. TaxID=2678536 RepID=UPI0032D9E007